MAAVRVACESRLAAASAAATGERAGVDGAEKGREPTHGLVALCAEAEELAAKVCALGGDLGWL